MHFLIKLFTVLLLLAVRPAAAVLEIQITLQGGPALPLNLPVEASIRRVVRKNVLLLPHRAVDAAGRVHLLDGRSTAVVLGARDDAQVEILSGLAEGDRVALSP